MGPNLPPRPVRDRIAAVGAKTAYIDPGGPWENGYRESFNGRFGDALLAGETLYNPREARIPIELWRRHDTAKRPHSALGDRPPPPETVVPMKHGPTMHQLSNWPGQMWLLRNERGFLEIVHDNALGALRLTVNQGRNLHFVGAAKGIRRLGNARRLADESLIRPPPRRRCRQTAQAHRHAGIRGCDGSGTVRAYRRCRERGAVGGAKCPSCWKPSGGSLGTRG